MDKGRYPNNEDDGKGEVGCCKNIENLEANSRCNHGHGYEAGYFVIHAGLNKIATGCIGPSSFQAVYKPVVTRFSTWLSKLVFAVAVHGKKRCFVATSVNTSHWTLGATRLRQKRCSARNRRIEFLLHGSLSGYGLGDNAGVRAHGPKLRPSSDR